MQRRHGKIRDGRKNETKIDPQERKMGNENRIAEKARGVEKLEPGFGFGYNQKKGRENTENQVDTYPRNGKAEFQGGPESVKRFTETGRSDKRGMLLTSKAVKERRQGTRSRVGTTKDEVAQGGERERSVGRGCRSHLSQRETTRGARIARTRPKRGKVLTAYKLDAPMRVCE